MRLRLFAILVLALILCVVVSGSPSAIYDQAAARLVCLSPPEGLELPAGQGVEFRCRVEAQSPATVEFWLDGVLARTEDPAPDGSTAMTWLPKQTGFHVLTILVRIGNREVARTTRQVLVTPSGSPVCVP